MTKVIASSETNIFDTIANFIRTPSTKKLLGWAAIIIVTTGIGWELISKGNDSKVDALSNQEQATTAVLETPTPKINANTVANITPEKTTDIHAESMKQYKEMSVDQFELLGLDTRLLYSQYILDSSLDGSLYNLNLYDLNYGVGKKSHEFEIKPTPASEDNNGQEIINNFLYLDQISFLQLIINPDSTKQYNSSDGIKLLSSIYYKVGNNNISKDYISDKKQKETLAKPGNMTNKYTATNTSDLLKSEGAGSSDNVSYKIVTYYTQDAKTLYARFIYHDFTSYDGTRKSIWLFDTQEETLDNLNKIPIN